MVVREVTQDGWRVRLDLSRQVLKLSVPEYDSSPDRLSPTVPSDGNVVSAAVLLWKAKQFDDGLLAAVDLAAQNGAGRFAGKADLLRSLAGVLSGPAGEFVHAASELGGLGVETPGRLRPSVRATVDGFLADENRSKPLGFSTWSDELRAVFRQDRFLQSELDPPVAAELASALAVDAGRLAAYEACLHLARKLTNPLAGADLRPLIAGAPAGGRTAWRLFPPSRSHEATLLERLYGDRPIPPGFDLMAELVRRVRSGVVSLEPAADAGWYDRVTWSLDPLLRPDATPGAARLRWDGRYRRHLEETFKGVLALARETQVKQLAGGYGGYGRDRRPTIDVRPNLTVEPVPDVYRRRADAYRFVRDVLADVFGSDALARLHRLTKDGPVAADLAAELDAVERLFRSAATASDVEIGLAATGGGVFRAWAARLADDPDVGGDARMMVPVYYDVGRNRTTVWAFLGWRTTRVSVGYETPPEVLALERGPAKSEPGVRFHDGRFSAATPVFVEVSVPRLLDRDEFRRLCDSYRTRERIVEALRRGANGSG